MNKLNNASKAHDTHHIRYNLVITTVWLSTIMWKHVFPKAALTKLIVTHVTSVVCYMCVYILCLIRMLDDLNTCGVYKYHISDDAN